jgi:hypothetical protein
LLPGTKEGRVDQADFDLIDITESKGKRFPTYSIKAEDEDDEDDNDEWKSLVSVVDSECKDMIG